MELYFFLEGKILFDNKEFLKRLVEIAQYKYKNYCISANKIKGISHRLNSLLIKINAALKVNEELEASYIVNTSTWVMLEGIWAINNKPIPSAGSALVHIKELSNRLTNLDNLLNKVLLGNTTEQINSAIIIIEWVLLNLEQKYTFNNRSPS